MRSNLALATLGAALSASFWLANADFQSDLQIVKSHVASNFNQTFRQPSGSLVFPYLVPSGPYNELWDWDSFFMGVSLLDYGSLPYLRGSMLNFLDKVDLENGEVQGCLKPTGATGSIYHAKPVLIQGSWIAAATNGTAAEMEAFKKFGAAMQATLDWWERPPQRENTTGLHVWHDQMQTGADDLVTSQCTSPYSIFCWREKVDAFTLASTDLHVFLSREYKAFSNFNKAWSESTSDHKERERLLETATRAETRSQEILAVMHKFMWDQDNGFYTAYNVSTNTQIKNRVFLMGLPLWTKYPKPSQAVRIAKQLMSADMLSPWGIRSTSSLDPLYENQNRILPYSNWRGPVWTNANAMITLGMASYPTLKASAQAIANALTSALANDLRDSGTWHECLSSDTGKGLAAPGFLSWNVLSASLSEWIERGRDPFAV